MESQEEETKLTENQIDEIRKFLEKLFEEKQKGLRNKSGLNQYQFRTSTYGGLHSQQHHLHSTS
ncbi:hypothetical protein HOLleu_19952 [Holothuria leucospilota]|uniref:Uncharacterized protein n=1 Tax=Holothuria leucospilota TaxID=206669 RepID=A0A9Q1C0T6_HOLLE|nr:hypothetical protein HOLleu_19952 [Holothuria leucospilota]